MSGVPGLTPAAIAPHVCHSALPSATAPGMANPGGVHAFPYGQGTPAPPDTGVSASSYMPASQHQLGHPHQHHHAHQQHPHQQQQHFAQQPSPADIYAASQQGGPSNSALYMASHQHLQRPADNQNHYPHPAPLPLDTHTHPQAPAASAVASRMYSVEPPDDPMSPYRFAQPSPLIAAQGHQQHMANLHPHYGVGGHQAHNAPPTPLAQHHPSMYAPTPSQSSVVDQHAGMLGTPPPAGMMHAHAHAHAAQQHYSAMDNFSPAPMHHPIPGGGPGAGGGSSVGMPYHQQSHPQVYHSAAASPVISHHHLYPGSASHLGHGAFDQQQAGSGTQPSPAPSMHSAHMMGMPNGSDPANLGAGPSQQPFRPLVPQPQQPQPAAISSFHIQSQSAPSIQYPPGSELGVGLSQPVPGPSGASPTSNLAPPPVTERDRSSSNSGTKGGARAGANRASDSGARGEGSGRGKASNGAGGRAGAGASGSKGSKAAAAAAEKAAAAAEAAAAAQAAANGQKHGDGGLTTVTIFQCRGFEGCNMTFSRSEHLARHVRKHTGERPFPCHCGKAFSRLDNLRQHAQTVHSDTPEKNEAMMQDLVVLHANLAASAAQMQHAHMQVTNKVVTPDEKEGKEMFDPAVSALSSAIPAAAAGSQHHYAQHRRIASQVGAELAGSGSPAGTVSGTPAGSEKKGGKKEKAKKGAKGNTAAAAAASAALAAATDSRSGAALDGSSGPVPNGGVGLSSAPTDPALMRDGSRPPPLALSMQGAPHGVGHGYGGMLVHSHQHHGEPMSAVSAISSTGATVSGPGHHVGYTSAMGGMGDIYAQHHQPTTDAGYHGQVPQPAEMSAQPDGHAHIEHAASTSSAQPYMNASLGHHAISHAEGDPAARSDAVGAQTVKADDATQGYDFAFSGSAGPAGPAAAATPSGASTSAQQQGQAAGPLATGPSPAAYASANAGGISTNQSSTPTGNSSSHSMLTAAYTGGSGSGGAGGGADSFTGRRESAFSSLYGPWSSASTLRNNSFGDPLGANGPFSGSATGMGAHGAGAGAGTAAGGGAHASHIHGEAPHSHDQHVPFGEYDWMDSYSMGLGFMRERAKSQSHGPAYHNSLLAALQLRGQNENASGMLGGGNGAGAGNGSGMSGGAIGDRRLSRAQTPPPNSSRGRPVSASGRPSGSRPVSSRQSFGLGPVVPFGQRPSSSAGSMAFFGLPPPGDFALFGTTFGPNGSISGPSPAELPSIEQHLAATSESVSGSRQGRPFTPSVARQSLLSSDGRSGSFFGGLGTRLRTGSKDFASSSIGPLGERRLSRPSISLESLGRRPTTASNMFDPNKLGGLMGLLPPGSSSGRTGSRASIVGGPSIFSSTFFIERGRPSSSSGAMPSSSTRAPISTNETGAAGAGIAGASQGTRLPGLAHRVNTAGSDLRTSPPAASPFMFQPPPVTTSASSAGIREGAPILPPLSSNRPLSSSRRLLGSMGSLFSAPPTADPAMSIAGGREPLAVLPALRFPGKRAADNEREEDAVSKEDAERHAPRTRTRSPGSAAPNGPGSTNASGRGKAGTAGDDDHDPAHDARLLLELSSRGSIGDGSSAPAKPFGANDASFKPARKLGGGGEHGSAEGSGASAPPEPNLADRRLSVASLLGPSGPEVGSRPTTAGGLAQSSVRSFLEANREVSPKSAPRVNGLGPAASTTAGGEAFVGGRKLPLDTQIELSPKSLPSAAAFDRTAVPTTSN